MKIIFAIVFSLTALVSFSQTQTIDSIPKDGVLLNTNWQFHAGDDDAGLHHDLIGGWQNIDPTTDVYFLNQVRDAEVGWLFLKLHFDSALLNQSYSLGISQTCASEIYLNGKLIYRLGYVSKDYQKERALSIWDNKFSLQLNGMQDQEIAVKISFNKKNLIINYIRENFLLRINLNSTNNIYGTYLSNYQNFASSREYILIACYILLTITTGFLLSSFRIQKAYLCFGIWSLISIPQAFLRIPVFNSSDATVTAVSTYSLLSHILSLVALISLVIGVYKLFNVKKSIFFYTILAYAILTIPAFFFLYPFSSLISLCFSFLISANFFKIFYKPAKEGNLGARILFITYSVFCILFISFIILLTIKQFEMASIFATSGLFVIPVGLLAFLANEYTVKAKSLQNKMKEVEELSQEKQHILLSQNETLEQQVMQRTSQLNQSLQELKSTQAQLIQSEKMASLGELTAGIAHEIQNPLNFVNNFSEVNTELIDELEQEADKGNLEEVKAIAGDIKENEQKINFHGKRADAIVKGMLLHSRQTKGIKEPTEINALCDEYLRLSYHGLRAKDKSFNANYITDFDKSIGKTSIVPQDFGRVLLNVYNNAFYAVNERQKTEGERYKPEVSVQTKKLRDKIEIRVSDNGNGIPQKMIDKIFQPFFTTKPTGQGTGLGLSLSYDIIEAHGGEMKVESKEGEGSEFVIQLPVV